MTVFSQKWRKYITSPKLNESKTYGMSVSDVLDMLEGYGRHTWIFFDTETTGFSPKKDQITEIAAIAISAGNWEEEPEVLGTFNQKIRLNQDILNRLKSDSPERQEWEKGQSEKSKIKEPQDILRFTRYGEKGRKYVDEQQSLNDFTEFLNSFENPMLVAQNASFDMKFVSTRWKKRLNKYPVLDTLPLIQLHIIPLLRVIRSGKFEPFNPKIQTRAKNILAAMKRGNFYSSSLGIVSTAYGISPEGWHNALADVKMTMNLFHRLHKTLKFGKDINIRPEHETAVSMLRRRQAWSRNKRKNS